MPSYDYHFSGLKIQKYKRKMKKFKTGCQWLTSIILATQEAEIRGIEIQSQPGLAFQDPILKNPFTKKGWWSGLWCRP
jgi:hypothetical protein